jgi:glycosyltransferase involved in cell wall biosynthesis
MQNGVIVPMPEPAVTPRPVPPLSVFIIARDEADRITRTLEAVSALSDDIIVIDSGSRDGTVALAKEAGARVIHNEWPGYGQQKRFAEQQCRHNWMLNLDADEVVPPELAGEIAALFAHGDPARAHHMRWPMRCTRSGSTGVTKAATRCPRCMTGWTWRRGRGSRG